MEDAPGNRGISIMAESDGPYDDDDVEIQGFAIPASGLQELLEGIHKRKVQEEAERPETIMVPPHKVLSLLELLDAAQADEKVRTDCEKWIWENIPITRGRCAYPKWQNPIQPVIELFPGDLVNGHLLALKRRLGNSFDGYCGMEVPPEHPFYWKLRDALYSCEQTLVSQYKFHQYLCEHWLPDIEVGSVRVLTYADHIVLLYRPADTEEDLVIPDTVPTWLS